MEKRAVVTINVGEVLCPNARRSFEAAAARWDAEYVELNGPCGPDAALAALLMLELFRLCAADRVFYIDGADAIIRGDAPSPFGLCPPSHLGAVRNDPAGMPILEDIRDQQKIEWALYNHCLRTRYPCASYFNSGVLVLTRATHAAVLDRARELAERFPEPRRLVRWEDQTLLNFAAVELGVPVLLMDETWNYMHPEDLGHWNSMERFVYHFAGSMERRRILPSLDWRWGWRARALRFAGSMERRRILPSPDWRSGWRARALRFARDVHRRMRRAVAPAERRPLHDLALKLTLEAVCREADRPVTRFDQLRVLPVRSGPVTQAQFMTPEFLFWSNRLKESPRWHRKLWEFVMICQALWERDMLRAGRRGCGFGVGQEPLPALFASLGCEVLAADALAGAAADPGEELRQRAAALEELNARNILPWAEFRARVRFQFVDVTSLPDDLGTFDFIWSSSARAHLGSLQAGTEFIANACRHLRPGSVAVHAIEYNVSSNEKTLDRGPVVLFRRRDVEEMRQCVSEAGCRMAEPHFDTGSGPMDLYADRPPYGTPHLKVAFRGFVTTSFLVIIERPPAEGAAPTLGTLRT
jgi:hypothetical protein